MDLFFRDTLYNIQVTWDELIDDLINTDSYNPYCYSKNYYEVFKQIISSMVLGEDIILLDSDFTTEELINLTSYSEFSGFNKNLTKNIFPSIKGKDELIKLLKNSNSKWNITLFTSGTTGIPKKITHSFDTITRFIKISERNSFSIWGFAYNPTHMAGIQVFFQALFNGNPIVRLLGLSKEDIYSEINLNKVTNISATPTFYRLLLPCNNLYPSVTHITSGGEKFDSKTCNYLLQIFPNARITNIYASTEAGTLFASDGNSFSIKPEMAHLIKIDENELLIHKSLMGTSEINVEEWYRTGDLLEILSQKPLRFRFIARKNEMINVGGYKVNPHEVEEIIRTISGIIDVRVYSKSNSILGSIICCEIVRIDNQLEEANIRAYLQTKLQEFKIPRMIRFVHEISITRTGKIKRN